MLNIANVLSANSEKRLQLEGILGEGELTDEEGDGGGGVEPTTSILCVPIFNSADKGKLKSNDKGRFSSADKGEGENKFHLPFTTRTHAHTHAYTHTDTQECIFIRYYILNLIDFLLLSNEWEEESCIPFYAFSKCRTTSTARVQRCVL